MSKFLGTFEYHHDRIPKLGVLLTNLGTPDAPTPPALRRYLKEFLSDPRVVETPRVLWWFILNGVILNLRPRRSAAAYAEIWGEDGSPLLSNTRQLTAAVSDRLNAIAPGYVEVALGMRYGNPSLASALESLLFAGCERLLVLPLYPQYSATTTASTFDAVSAVLQRARWLPELRFVTNYHDADVYIQAMAEHIRRFWVDNGPSNHLLFSYHGIPKRYFMNGDPYHCHCHKTSRLVADALELAVGSWQTTFQSRFGREEWLKPYTDKTLKQLPKGGHKQVDIVCPGFSADCLETLEEIAVENRDYFLAAGGERYRYIPALNATDLHVSAVVELIRRHTVGWPQLDGADARAALKVGARETLRRASALGAKA
ncbi:MAG: ferrochelatase [Thiotrichales bacterium]